MDTVSGLVPVRKVREFSTGGITVCKNSGDGELYTVIIVKKRPEKLMFVEADEQMRKNGGEYRFSMLQSDGGVLTVAAPYVQPRRMVDFAALSYHSTEEKVGLCLRLVRACMVSGMPWWLLYLCLTRENVQMYASGAVKFDMFIDLDNINAEKTERDCARRCGALVRDILSLMTGMEKRGSNAYQMVQMMERNDSYTTLLQLHRDLDTVYKNPLRTLPVNRIFDWCKAHMTLISKVLRVTAAVFALVIAAVGLKIFIFKDISFPDFRYGGLDRIGEINLRE